MSAVTVRPQPDPFDNIAIVPTIAELIAGGAPVAIGVSGGKDSQAAALATFEHLDRVGHTGPRILIHSGLGIVEWNASLPVCERLADHPGCELVGVVRRNVSRIVGLRSGCLDRSTIHARYAELIAQRELRAAA